MWFGALLVVAGLSGSVVGIRLAATRNRPVDLGGALLATAGFFSVWLGAGRCLSPLFFE